MTSSLFRAERVRNFNGFTLKPGMWAGRDEKGFFACTRIMQKKDPGHYLHLYRLDKEMNRGWSMVWESSETTREIMRAVRPVLETGMMAAQPKLEAVVQVA